MLRAGLVLSVLLCSAAVAGESWYVAVGGDDAAAGSLQQPFATVERAQEAVGPGDTVFIRGGVYRLAAPDPATAAADLFARLIVLDKSGRPESPITYRSYADEKPVFDCRDARPAKQRVTAFFVSGSWLRLIGLEVVGVQVTITTHTQSICFESVGSHNVFERLAMHDGQAIGIYHHGRGGNVDGFGCHPAQGGTGNVFRGCRAWHNSDDGFDCINAAEAVTFEDCWAAFNGLSPDGTKLADGNGFKAGGYGSTPAERLPVPIPRHVVRRCLAVGNRSSGFYANHHPGGCDWIANRAFRNGVNYNMLGRLPDNRTDVDGAGHVLRDNESHGSRRDLVAIDRAACTLSGNSFDGPPGRADVDVPGPDEAELFAPREPDGSLPPIGTPRGR